MAFEELVRRYQALAVRTATVNRRLRRRRRGRLPGRVRQGLRRPWVVPAGRTIPAVAARIVANEARNRRRSAGRRANLALRVAEDRRGRDAAPSPEAAVLDHERRRTLFAALSGLRDEDREIVGALPPRAVRGRGRTDTWHPARDRQVTALARARAPARLARRSGARGRVMTDDRALRRIDDDTLAMGDVARTVACDARAGRSPCARHGPDPRGGDRPASSGSTRLARFIGRRPLRFALVAALIGLLLAALAGASAWVFLACRSSWGPRRHRRRRPRLLPRTRRSGRASAWARSCRSTRPPRWSTSSTAAFRRGLRRARRGLVQPGRRRWPGLAGVGRGSRSRRPTSTASARSSPPSPVCPAHR